MGAKKSASSRRLLAVSWLFTVLPLIAASSLLFAAIPEHGMDPDWPAHARFHVIWASLKFLALGIMAAIISRTAFVAGNRWSWWALTTYVVVGVGGLFLAMIWQGGAPPLRALIMVSIMTGLMALGLILTADIGFGRRSN